MPPSGDGGWCRAVHEHGGFMFNAQELSTAVQQGLGVVAVRPR